MTYQIILIYCVCDDLLKVFNVRDDSQVKMSTAEVMSVVLIAALLFYGNHDRARLILKAQGFFPNMLSKSQLNRRLHAIDPAIWQRMMGQFAETFHQLNQTNEYIVDSFPVAACQNCRIFRAKLLRGKEYRGYCASKNTFFYGLKVHMVTSASGCPIEVIFSTGNESDITAFRKLNLDLPAGSRIYGDRAYTDYEYEDLLLDVANTQLIAQRKANSKRPLIGPIKYLQSTTRKRIETSFSCITRLFPRHINAVRQKGFELKIFTFILAFCFIQLVKIAT